MYILEEGIKGLREILQSTLLGFDLKARLEEGIKQELKPPTWIKGYEALWWAAVARYVGDQDPDVIKGDGKAYGGVTQIFKAYLTRMTGYNVDTMKQMAQEKGEKVKSGDIVANAKKDMVLGIQQGSPSAASQISRIGGLNKALASIMKYDGKKFIQAVREKIYDKYLAKGIPGESGRKTTVPKRKRRSVRKKA